MTKTCTKCGQELTINNFTSDKTKKDGYYPSCRICCRRYKISKGLIKLKEKLSVGYKRCTKCRKVKEIKEYLKDCTKKDGLYSSCSDCTRKRLGIKKRNPSYMSVGYKTRNSKRLHRTIIENRLGRKLNRKEIVHHLDGNKLNNNPDNLKVMTHSEHAKHHYQFLKDKLRSDYERSIKCVICHRSFISKNGKSKYCSPHCFYVSRIEYTKRWINLRKSIKI